MKRPEKKICKSCYGQKRLTNMYGDYVDCPYCHLVYQYNQACDKWEAYHNWVMGNLPSEEEIEKIIKDNWDSMCPAPIRFAKAISKRLKGEE